MLVVIAILVVLASLIAPAAFKAQEKGRQAKCLGNIKNIGLALRQYSLDNDNLFPIDKGQNTSSKAFMILTNGSYLRLSSVYLCPSSAQTPWSSGPLDASNNSYAYVIADNTFSNALLGNTTSENPLVMDRELNGIPDYISSLNNNSWLASSPHKPAGGNVVYIGGQAAFKVKFTLTADGTNGYIIPP